MGSGYKVNAVYGGRPISKDKIELKESKGAKYTSITSRALMKSSEDVVAVYKKMAMINDLASL